MSFGVTHWERSGVAIMLHCVRELIKMQRAILLLVFLVGHHSLTHHNHSFHSSFGCKSISIIPLIELSNMFCAPFLSFLFISCHRTGLITVYWILIQLRCACYLSFSCSHLKCNAMYRVMHIFKGFSLDPLNSCREKTLLLFFGHIQSKSILCPSEAHLKSVRNAGDVCPANRSDGPLNCWTVDERYQAVKLHPKIISQVIQP